MSLCRARFFAIWWLFFTTSLLASVPKIVDISQNDGALEIRFNKPISEKSFRFFRLNSDKNFRDVYDVEAILTFKNPPKRLENINLRIAQNDHTRVRIVLSAANQFKSKLSTDKNLAAIKIDSAKNLSIAALFDGVLSEQKYTIMQESKQNFAKESKESANRISTKEPIKESKNRQDSSQNIVAKTNKRVVLDPGHGGKDCGALGVGKVCEKEVVLKVAKYLAEELKKRGYKVFLTRDKDRFINLRERTKFANDKEADIFISIHANSVPKEKQERLQGIESYFLATARSERAKNAAALENKDDISTMNHFSKQSFLNALNSQRSIASNRLAIDIQAGMLNAVRAKFSDVLDGGVREGPFWVLAGALMPSVLLELGYITHPEEGKRLTLPSYQKSLALGIAEGIDGYFLKNF